MKPQDDGKVCSSSRKPAGSIRVGVTAWRGIARWLGDSGLDVDAVNGFTLADSNCFSMICSSRRTTSSRLARCCPRPAMVLSRWFSCTEGSLIRSVCRYGMTREIWSTRSTRIVGIGKKAMHPGAEKSLACGFGSTSLYLVAQLG